MENVGQKTPLIHPLENQPSKQNELSYVHLAAFLIGAILLGIIVGFAGSKVSKIISSANKGTTNANVAKTAGIADKKTFKDQAVGILKEGGVDGEGNFHLERPGGQSQNVYLTSTTVDLSKYIGKKVRVWGETFSAEKAGWLMDVGLVELLQ